ncbi:MAG: hypothetical protein IJX64_02740 [Clostridia bacterium]|nr:hypothetical protein [Clostridia bacterium]
MDENKNTEMSVDELLKKLQESLQTDVQEEEKPTDAAADNTDKTDADELAALADLLKSETSDESAEAEQSEGLEASEASEKTEVSEEPDALEVSMPSSEPDAVPTMGEINEDDIFAAWGIDRAEMEQRKAETIEVSMPRQQSADDAAAAPVVTANTKIYYITRVEKKEEFALRKQTEAQKDSTDYDRTDYSLIKQALGMEQPDAEDMNMEYPIFEEIPSKDDAPKTIDEPHSEFTYQRQKEDITTDYKRFRRNSGVKLLFTFLITAALFLVECLPLLGVTLPDVLSIAYYPVVYSMVTLQLMLLACAFSYKEIANGLLSLAKWKLHGGSVLAILSVLTLVCDIVNCAFGMKAPMYNFSVAFCALLLRAFDYLDVSREAFTFEVASSTQSKKYVAVTVPAEKASRLEGLEDYTGEDSLVLRTEKCSFVENYFSRTEKRSESDAHINKILVPITLAVAVITAILSVTQGADVSAAFGVFNAAIAVGLPVLVLLSSAYPLYKACRRLYRRESAIIGESSVEDYSGTTMICFDDADAFPSYGVALENLRIYGKGDIETIIEQMGAVFSKLGGPLKHVFSLMITDCPKPYKVKIEGVYEDGICAAVDGKTLFVGNAAYMAENGFTVVDKSDEIGGKRFSTMYLAQDGSLRAKFYIRYTLDGSFESIVKKLARRGIASVILTGDSNINDELLARSIDMKKLPIKVARRQEFESPVRSDRADSGIVSRGGVGDLVSAVTMCDRLAGVIGTMRAVRIASAVICAFLMIAACLLGMYSSVSSLYVLLYHLFWLLPAWLVAKINL